MGFFSGSNRAARQNRAGGGIEAPDRLAPDPINPARAPSAQPLDRPVLRAALSAIGWPENPLTAVDGNRCMLPTRGQTPPSARRPISRINLQRRNSPFLSSRTRLVQQKDRSRLRAIYPYSVGAYRRWIKQVDQVASTSDSLARQTWAEPQEEKSESSAVSENQLQ